MKTIVKKISVIVMLMMVLFTIGATVYAANPEKASQDTQSVELADQTTKGSKALAAGIAIGLASLGGAIGMGIAVARSSEGISRQPEAEGKIRTTLMLGLVFVETAIIYALIVAILIIFVL